MHIWSNTNTLEGYIPEISFSRDKTTAEVALVGGKGIDLQEFPHLRGIFKTGVGRDNVPEAEARARGIACGFPSEKTAAIIYAETATFTCHLILRCLYAEVGDFVSWKKLDRSALQARELLVLGMGNIGRQVATKMQQFLKVSVFDALTHKSEELEPLVRRADCVSLHVPLTSDTAGIFDASKLSWMKPGAAIVNTARGAVVDEKALFAELATGRLRAAFDVFWQEPYQGELTRLPADRFIASPHIASTCREFLAATAEDFRNFLTQVK